MKKLKFMPAVLMLVASFAILAIGIYAITPTKNTISGTITINSANPEVLISAFFHNEDGSLNTQTPIMTRVPARHGVEIDLGDEMVFNTSECNTQEDLQDLDIKVTIRVENPGSTALGVYFSDKVMEAEATSGDIATEKALTDSTGEDDFVKATMEGYQELPAKSGEDYGMVETTITYSLQQFVTGDTNPTVDLNAEANRMYLNIEKFNESLVPLIAQVGVSSSCETPVSVEVLVDGVSVTGGTEATGSSARALSSVSPLTTDIEVSSENSIVIDVGGYVFDPDKEDNSKKVTLRLTNNSESQSFGAYYYTGTALPNEDNDELGIKAGYADADAIKLEGEVFDRTDGTKIADVILDTYSYLAKADGDTSDFDVLDMDIEFIPYGTHSAVKTGGFEFALNIEPYIANCTAVNKGNGSAGTTFNGNLLKVEASVLTISRQAFYNNKDISHVVLPSSITSIDADAFRECSNLTGIRIPESVISMGSQVFYHCNKLISIRIPESVTSISDYVLAGCSSIKSIIIPNGVSLSYLEEPFSVCSSLKSVSYETSGTGYEFKDGTLTITSAITTNTTPKWKTENLNPLILKVEWAEGVAETTTNIPLYSFYCAYNLTRITIPSSVNSIGSSAFSNCSSLTSVTYETSGTGYEFKDGILTITSAITTNTKPEWYTLNLNQLILDIQWTEAAKMNTIIPQYSFYDADRLSSVTIPEGVGSIGNYAFCHCGILTNVTIPEGVTSIGSDSFRQCTSLTNIIIPEGVITIGASAFDTCIKLTSITISESVTSIGSSAFSDCSSLTSITIPGKVTSIDMYAFRGCSSLTSITIPESVINISAYVFDGCIELTSITIKSGTDLNSDYNLPTLSKDGYAFNGWYDNAEGNGDPITAISADAYGEDTTYYAVWTENAS